MSGQSLQLLFHRSGGSRIFRRGGMDPLGGRGHPTWALFDENVCETKELGPIGGVRGARPLDPPMHRGSTQTSPIQIPFIIAFETSWILNI